ncbi:putative C-type lectin domain family 20 member A [Misgurnus anguillicaudatus]|uniref:putative C-type lectin domain family 20 member A n=1 Tax=Misgurnus anguillicaudatus TaxID=75329 RepID=UPI003CCFD378
MQIDYIMESLIHLLLFLGLCLFTQTISCQYSYILIQQMKTWYKAQAYCRQNHNDLATVQSNEDWTRLHEIVKNNTMSSVAWTGLYNDINSWRWSYKNENITFTYWCTGEPDNWYGKEECSTLSTVLGWTDRNCMRLYPLLCLDETQTGAKRFVLIGNVMTWREAQIYCRQHFTDLATIRTKADNDLIVQIMKAGLIPEVWIGLFRDSWKWSDGSNVSTSPINWEPGDPNLGGVNQACGAANARGLIVDELCVITFPFICMQTESMKEMVRVEVKSGNNLNDPAVLDSILKLIKQKLKDHVMENTKLTWRLQPDGNVFSPKYNQDKQDSKQPMKTCVNTIC